MYLHQQAYSLMGNISCWQEFSHFSLSPSSHSWRVNKIIPWGSCPDWHTKHELNSSTLDQLHPPLKLNRKDGAQIIEAKLISVIISSSTQCILWGSRIPMVDLIQTCKFEFVMVMNSRKIREKHSATHLGFPDRYANNLYCFLWVELVTCNWGILTMSLNNTSKLASKIIPWERVVYW